MLTPDQSSRAVAAILGMASGDALGAGYEFGPPLAAGTEVGMVGGGVFDWAPGEWTDDTSMAFPLLAELAAGNDLRDEATLDSVCTAWITWAATAQDVGNQVRAVLSASQPTASAVRASAVRASAALFTSGNPRAAGNGSLMRTAPVALGYLNDRAALIAAARAVSELTHPDPDAVDACVIWCELIRTAILTGSYDLDGALESIANRDVWRARFDEAEAQQPVFFSNNGWVVHAIQAAWSAIAHTPEEPSQLRIALETIARSGGDTDTVAAIAGGLLGARWGTAAIPAHWRSAIHGWPSSTADDLERLALAAVS